MSDPRTWTPGRGTRTPPRETGEILRSLGIEPEALAKEVRRATPAWLEWVKLVPIYAILGGGIVAVGVKWDRSVSDRDLVVAEATAERRARGLELQLAAAEREALVLRKDLDAAVAQADRRLDALEKRTTPTKKGR